MLFVERKMIDGGESSIFCQSFTDRWSIDFSRFHSRDAKKRSSWWMQRPANKAWWRRARAKRLFDSCGLPQNWELTNLDEPADTRRVAQSRPWHRLNPRAMPLTHARTRQRMRPRSVKRSSWPTRKVDRQFIRTSVPDEFPWHVAFLIACLTV